MYSNVQFIIGTVLAVVSIVYSYYLYKISKQKTSLTPYLRFHSTIFSGIDPELRKDLVIHYKNVAVDNIHQLLFIIVNNGNKPIKDIINPLQLIVPEDFEILDANINQIHPEGRIVDKHIIGKKIVEFDIPLLNSQDFFKLKLLLKSGFQTSSVNGRKELVNEIKFKITSDDLPPVLKVADVPRHLYSHNSISSLILTIGLFFLLILGFTAIVITNQPLKNIVPNNTFYSFIFLGLIIALAMFVTSRFDAFIRKRKMKDRLIRAVINYNS